jgi:glycolate oxidase iron-sulfur subunit
MDSLSMDSVATGEAYAMGEVVAMSEPRAGRRSVTASPLGLDPVDLASCVSCGLCLPHCPTFRVTGEEAYSPRGRVDAMRGVQIDELPIDDSFVDFMETCVQCRGCEPACPSGVPFGSLMEQTRASLAESERTVPRWQRIGYSLLGRHRTLLAGSTLLAVAQRLVPRRVGLPEVPIRRPPPLESTGDDVWLFTGCVMDAWQRDTHANTAALVSSVGATYAVPGAGGACCGALHVHAGLHDGAAELARRVIASMPGEAPIVVNSAGCGAALKDYGRLLGTPGAQAFSARVVDVLEWLAERADRW